MTTFLNMDLGLMRPLRLDDVFVGEYQEPLTDLIWNQLMADNEAKTRAELEDMGYGSTGEIAPTENFYLDKDGVTFYYNVYDITPYAMGPVTVSIPFQMLEHMLGSNPVVGELKIKIITYNSYIFKKWKSYSNIFPISRKNSAGNSLPYTTYTSIGMPR